MGFKKGLEIDSSDERFKNVFNKAEFAIDPTEKRSKRDGAQQVLELQKKRKLKV